MNQYLNKKIFLKEKYLILLLILLGFISYSNTFNSPFIFDDYQAIEINPYIRNLSLDVLQAPPVSCVDRRPTVSLTLAINYQISKLNTWSYHLFNLITHITSSILIFKVLIKTFDLIPKKLRWIKNIKLASLGVALLWLVHPLQTESVTYISTRTESLSSFFYILTLYLFIKSVQSSSTFIGILTLLSCYLGMGCKEIFISAPFFLLIYDRNFFSKNIFEALSKRKIFYLFLFSSCLIPLLYLVFSPTMLKFTQSSPESNRFFFQSNLNFVNNLRTQCGVLMYYIKLIFWPDQLNPSHSSWPISQSLADSWVQITFTLFLITSTVLTFIKQKHISLIGILFFFLLAPTMLIPMPLEIVAERRIYLASVSIFIIIIFLLNKLSERINKKFSIYIQLSPVLLSLFLAYLTYQRNEIYKSKESFWTSVIQVEPNNFKAHYALGNSFLLDGNINDAKQHFMNSIKIQPNFADSWISLGNIYLYENELSKARAMFTKSLGLFPIPEKGYIGLGLIYKKLKQYEKAEGAFLKVIKSPHKDEINDYSFYLAFADVLFIQQKYKRSLEYYSKANQLKPNDPKILFNWAAALFHSQQIEEAITVYKNVIKINPYKINAYINLASILKNKKDALTIIENGIKKLNTLNRPDLSNQLNSWKNKNLMK